ncbi:MAG: response regulator, partial [Cyanobacteriota bacterium]|nr:response regulator [Cyanobacteriota bacterium]
GDGESGGAGERGSGGDGGRVGNEEQQRTDDQELRTKNQELRTNDKRRIHFEIEDTGCGIAPEEIGQLFEAFSQTETGKQAREGTGLGLHISRKFVQLMGGEISVASNGYRFVPGRDVEKIQMRSRSRLHSSSSSPPSGTTFAFDIRVEVVSQTEVAKLEPAQPIVALAPDQPEYRILVVDDNALNRQLLVKLLAPLGFQVSEASSGREAIERWQQWKPHLIFMDMRMPDMNGYEATQRIKSTPQGQATAIIALTASALEQEYDAILAGGCDDCLRKPFQEEEIFAAMKEHIGVRYIDNESRCDAREKPEEQGILVLDADAIAALPTQWIEALQQAVLQGDSELFGPLLDQISAEYPNLARAIGKRLDNFEYDKILNLISDKAINF